VLAADQGAAPVGRYSDGVEALLSSVSVIPVVVLDDDSWAAPLADALVAGGLCCVEITFRTSAALAAIASLSERGDVLVAAGTVTTTTQVDQALEAGARFAVSPGFDEVVAQRCVDVGLPLLPGVSTASDIMRARRAGFHVLKLFPAEAIGGLRTLNALAAPFPDVRFVPTGGINETLAVSYLAHPAVLAIGGSWMVPHDAIVAQAWSRVESAARAATALSKDVRR